MTTISEQIHLITKEQADNTAVIMLKSHDGRTELEWDVIRRICPNLDVALSLRNDQSIEFLTEEDMANYGWVRAK